MKSIKTFLLLVSPILIGIFLVINLQSQEEKTFSFSQEKLVPSVESEIVELNEGDSFELSAEMITKEINGELLTLMGYNGSIPGPTIKVQQGATVKINFTNNTPIENTIHSHGIRLANQFDGVPDVTQLAVQPGESFEYEIVFPDAGTYWYHPHVRVDVTQEMGLYGAFVVEPTEPSYWNEVNQEEYVFLDDYLSSEDGLFTFYTDFITHTLMGRYGDEYLINGNEDYELEVEQNSTVRFTFLNVANVRPFNISIDGITTKLVGSDGGRYENESFVDSVILGPSERYLLEAYFDEPGTYALQHITPEKTYELGTITVLEKETDLDLVASFETLRTSTLIQDEISDFESYYKKTPDKSLRLTVEMDMQMMEDATISMPGGSELTGIPCHQMPNGMMMGDCDTEIHEDEDGIEWEDEMEMMNQLSTDLNLEWQIVDENTGDINDEINWDFELGEYIVVEMENDKDSMHPMQHPIHFHGQRFTVLSENGLKNENLVWKDTVLVPTGYTIRILLEVSNPGEWMAHCHIAEHLHSGMMFDFDVE